MRSRVGLDVVISMKLGTPFGSSFRIFTTIVSSDLWTGRNLALLSWRMLSKLRWIVLIVITVRMAAIVLRILMHLLRARSEMLLTLRWISTHIGHRSWLLMRKYGLVILHGWTHAIHWLTLLRSLRHHHWRTTSGTRIAISSGHCGRRSTARRHEMALASGVLHMWTRSNHSMRSTHGEISRRNLYHHWAAHMCGLLWNELVATRVRAILCHLLSPRAHWVLHLTVGKLCWLRHWGWRGECHIGLL